MRMDLSWFLLLLLLFDVGQSDVVFTSERCDSGAFGLQLVPGDPSRYRQCGPAGRVWIVPCAPNMSFDPQAKVCREDVARAPQRKIDQFGAGSRSPTITTEAPAEFVFSTKKPKRPRVKGKIKKTSTTAWITTTTVPTTIWTTSTIPTTNQNAVYSPAFTPPNRRVWSTTLRPIEEKTVMPQYTVRYNGETMTESEFLRKLAGLVKEQKEQEKEEKMKKEIEERRKMEEEERRKEDFERQRIIEQRRLNKQREKLRIEEERRKEEERIRMEEKKRQLEDEERRKKVEERQKSIERLDRQKKLEEKKIAMERAEKKRLEEQRRKEKEEERRRQEEEERIAAARAEEERKESERRMAEERAKKQRQHAEEQKRLEIEAEMARITAERMERERIQKEEEERKKLLAAVAQEAQRMEETRRQAELERSQFIQRERMEKERQAMQELIEKEKKEKESFSILRFPPGPPTQANTTPSPVTHKPDVWVSSENSWRPPPDWEKNELEESVKTIGGSPDIRVVEGCIVNGDCPFSYDFNLFCPHPNDPMSYLHCAPMLGRRGRWTHQICPGGLVFSTYLGRCEKDAASAYNPNDRVVIPRLPMETYTPTWHGNREIVTVTLAPDYGKAIRNTIDAFPEDLLPTFATPPPVTIRPAFGVMYPEDDGELDLTQIRPLFPRVQPSFLTNYLPFEPLREADPPPDGNIVGAVVKPLIKKIALEQTRSFLDRVLADGISKGNEEKDRLKTDTTGTPIASN